MNISCFSFFFLFIQNRVRFTRWNKPKPKDSDGIAFVILYPLVQCVFFPWPLGYNVVPRTVFFPFLVLFSFGIQLLDAVLIDISLVLMVWAFMDSGLDELHIFPICFTYDSLWAQTSFVWFHSGHLSSIPANHVPNSFVLLKIRVWWE